MDGSSAIRLRYGALPARWVSACMVGVAGIFMSCVVCAQDARSVQFDAGFLPDGLAMGLDLSRYAHGNPVLPGVYDVDIWMNDEWQVRRTVRFVERYTDNDASPCLSRAELESFGLVRKESSSAEDDCAPISERIPQSTARLDVAEQRLDIEVPQAWLVRRPRGVAPREQWKDGVTAALLAWRANFHQSALRHRSSRSLFLTGDAGLNLGRYRFRHAGSWSQGQYRQGHTFVERAVDRLQARWRAGDVIMGDDLLEPVLVCGVRLASDVRMRPDAGDGYAPQVRGVAATHARVTVSQGGRLLRELSVPPGAFVIDDLGVAGRGGDLSVEIVEADGRRIRYRVPYFSLPLLMREGATRYSMGMGRWRGGSSRQPWLLEAAWRRGVRHGWTVQAAQRVIGSGTWLVGGAAVDTLVGAFSADVTHALARRAGPVGTLWRLRYGHRSDRGGVISATVSGGAQRMAAGAMNADRSPARQRRADISYQHMFDEAGGSFGLAFGYTHLPDSGGGEWDQALSWSHVKGAAVVDVSLRRSLRTASRSSGRASENTAQVSVSLPLDGERSRVASQAALRMGPDGKQLRAGLLGSAGSEGAWGYAASAATHAGGPRLDASVSRASGGGDLSVAVERSRVSRAASLSASGGIVAHAGGITLAPFLGNASGLVQARHARGARLASASSVHVDRRGYAIVPSLAPYRWNSVDIDPTGLPLGVSLASTHARVVPTAGAVVLIPFETDEHATILLTGRRSDGAPLPFGAEVVDDQGRSIGVIGQGGRSFLRSDGGTPALRVRWSDQAGGGCDLRPTLAGERAGLKHYEGVCR